MNWKFWKKPNKPVEVAPKVITEDFEDDECEECDQEDCETCDQDKYNLTSHSWTIHETLRIRGSIVEDGYIRTIYVLRCEHCGDIKHHTVNY